MYALGRKVNHDERSWAYRVERGAQPKTVRWNRQTPVLDQGNLGSCTGNAGTGVLGTTPFLATLGVIALDENYAVQLYSDATQIDSDPQNYPPVDTGSDGLSIAKVLKTRGVISGYQHAFGITDAFAAIQQGPLMIGVSWYRSMFSPNAAGVVTASGQIDGGHEFECIGYDTNTDLWEFVNSWGTSWGKAGHFFMSTATFTKLLNEQGDIILLTPLTAPAPAPTPAPTDEKAEARARLDAWAAKRHTGATKQAAKDWLTLSGDFDSMVRALDFSTTDLKIRGSGAPGDPITFTRD